MMHAAQRNRTAEPLRAFAERRLEWIEVWLDTHAYVALSAWLSLLAVVLWANIHARPPWHDEICFLWLGTRPNLAEMWRVLVTGVMSDPPLTPVLLHFAGKVIGPTIETARLLAAVGFMVFELCLFAYVRRRASPIFALAACVISVSTACWYYASEGRCYGPLLGFTGLTLYCWDRLSTPGAHWFWLPTFSLCLGSCLSSHFFAVFLLVPFCASAIYRVLRRQPRAWAGAVAMAAGTLPLLAWLPIALSLRQFSANYFAKPGPGSLLRYYSDFAADGTPLAAAVLVFLLCLLRASWLLPLAGGDKNQAIPRDNDALILSAGFLLIPLLAWIAGVLYLKAFVFRYVLIAVIGWILAVPVLSWTLFGASKRVALCILLAFGASGGVKLLSDVRIRESQWTTAKQRYRALAELIPRDEPDTLIIGEVQYMPVYYYSPEPVRKKLAVVYDRGRSSRTVGHDTNDLIYELLARLSSFRMYSFEAYIREHKVFYVLDMSPQFTAKWLEIWLEGRPFTQRLVKQSAAGRLLEIRQP